MPPLLKQKLYKLCDALGYERRYFKSTIDSVLVFLTQLEPADQQFIHVQAIAFIERILQNIAQGKKEPGAELMVTVADIREIQKRLSKVDIHTLTEFKNLFQAIQAEVFTLIKDIKAQLQSKIDQQMRLLKTDLEIVVTTRKAMIDKGLAAKKQKLSPQQLEAEYKKELEYHLTFQQNILKFFKRRHFVVDVLLAEAAPISERFVEKYKGNIAATCIDFDKAVEIFDQFNDLSLELSASNLELILTEIGENHPGLMPQLQRLKVLYLYYPMSILNNIMFNFDVLVFDEGNLQLFLAQNDAAIAAVFKDYNEIQNIKAIILAIISLAIKLYMDIPPYNLRSIASREDVPFYNVVKMEAGLLALIDWKVEVDAQDYERIRQQLDTEFLNLPSIADLDKAERQQSHVAKKGDLLYREVRGGLQKVTSPTSKVDQEATEQQSATYLKAAKDKLKSAKKPPIVTTYSAATKAGLPPSSVSKSPSDSKKSGQSSSKKS